MRRATIGRLRTCEVVVRPVRRSSGGRSAGVHAVSLRLRARLRRWWTISATAQSTATRPNAELIHWLSVAVDSTTLAAALTKSTSHSSGRSRPPGLFGGGRGLGDAVRIGHDCLLRRTFIDAVNARRAARRGRSRQLDDRGTAGCTFRAGRCRPRPAVAYVGGGGGSMAYVRGRVRASVDALEHLVGGLGTAPLALGALLWAAIVAVTCLVGVGLLAAPGALRAVRSVADRERRSAVPLGRADPHAGAGAGRAADGGARSLRAPGTRLGRAVLAHRPGDRAGRPRCCRSMPCRTSRSRCGTG